MLGLQSRNLYICRAQSNGDLKTHLQSEKHHKSVRGAVFGEMTSKMTNNFVTAESKCEDEITAAEGTLAFYAVKHHYSFLFMDCTSVLLEKIFPDSDVVKKFSSGRTKTEKVVTSVLAQNSINAVLKSFENISRILALQQMAAIIMN